MRGTVARRLRRIAFKKYPQGSTLGFTAAGELLYDGYYRYYRALKQAWRRSSQQERSRVREGDSR